MKPTPEIALLIHAIEEGFHRKAWHGTNLRGSIRGLSEQEANRRPGKNRHNIREIVVHCAYWKYAVKRRLTGLKRGSFPLKGSNWFLRPGGSGDDGNWLKEVKLLDQMHRELVEVIREMPAAALDTIPKGSKVNNRMIISGIAMHDVYHAGQIQLLKKFIRSRH